MLTAAVLSVVAGCQVRNLWGALPGVKLMRLDAAEYRQALREARAGMSLQAHDALITANISSLFTAAMREPDVYDTNRTTVRQMVGELRHTHLGRLQMAAFVMLELEQSGAEPDTWWRTVEPVLRGMETAKFHHHLAPLLEQRANVFRSLRFRMGSAWAQARATVGHPHGPLLQFLDERLERLAQARSATDDDSAELCRRLMRRLLKQWILAEGPAGLRLLAADLLARRLESDAGDVADQLRAWRTAYTEAAAELPVAPHSLRGWQGPDPVAVSAESGGRALLALLCLAAATSVAAALTLILGVASLRSRVAPPAPDQTRAGVCIAGLLAFGCVIYLLFDPSAADEDVRRLLAVGTGWPRTPLIAAVLTAIGVGLALIRPGSRLKRTFRVAAWTWLLAAVATLVAVQFAGLSLAMYEKLTYSAGRMGDYAAVAGHEPDALLDGLRVWEP